MRIGCGFDVHRLVSDRPLILGGVRIPSKVGLEGHSDADVLAHSITDALLGAAALGDIGVLFPDDEEKWAGANSLELLTAAYQKIEGEGFAVENIDATVALQAPKLRPHIDGMRANIASSLGVEIGRVSVKATTTERLGFVGREEGAAAYAVALLSEAEKKVSKG